jgi:hypothetical protein
LYREGINLFPACPDRVPGSSYGGGGPTAKGSEVVRRERRGRRRQSKSELEIEESTSDPILFLFHSFISQTSAYCLPFQSRTPIINGAPETCVIIGLSIRL